MPLIITSSSLLDEDDVDVSQQYLDGDPALLMEQGWLGEVESLGYLCMDVGVEEGGGAVNC